MSDLASRPVFDWPYYSVSVIYQDNSPRVRLGRGYTFSAEPDGPPQRVFKLRFEALKWETSSNGRADPFIEPKTNLFRLEKFYRTVEMWKTFWFDLPAEGFVLVRFNKPLEIPYGVKGGSGAVTPVEIELIEQPLPWPTPDIPEFDPTFDSSTILFDNSIYTWDQEL
jgi:hypothetical protein